MQLNSQFNKGVQTRTSLYRLITYTIHGDAPKVWLDFHVDLSVWSEFMFAVNYGTREIIYDHQTIIEAKYLSTPN